MIYRIKLSMQYEWQLEREREQLLVIARRDSDLHNHLRRSFRWTRTLFPTVIMRRSELIRASPICIHTVIPWLDLCYCTAPVTQPLQLPNKPNCVFSSKKYQLAACFFSARRHWPSGCFWHFTFCIASFAHVAATARRPVAACTTRLQSSGQHTFKQLARKRWKVAAEVTLCVKLPVLNFHTVWNSFSVAQT